MGRRPPQPDIRNRLKRRPTADGEEARRSAAADTSMVLAIAPAWRRGCDARRVSRSSCELPALRRSRGCRRAHRLVIVDDVNNRCLAHAGNYGFRATLASTWLFIEVLRSLEHRVGVGRPLRDRLDHVPVLEDLAAFQAEDVHHRLSPGIIAQAFPMTLKPHSLAPTK